MAKKHYPAAFVSHSLSYPVLHPDSFLRQKCSAYSARRHLPSCGPHWALPSHRRGAPPPVTELLGPPIPLPSHPLTPAALGAVLAGGGVGRPVGYAPGRSWGTRRRGTGSRKGCPRRAAAAEGEASARRTRRGRHGCLEAELRPHLQYSVHEPN